MKQKQLATTLIHTGEVEYAKKMAKQVSQPKVLPIYMNSVFSFDDVEMLDAVYEQRAEGYVYSRMCNPGSDAVQEILAKAESADDALVFSSGMAAITTTFLSQVQAGDHIIASSVLYGGVYDFLKNELPRFQIEVDFVNFDTEDIASYVKENTKIIYTETISNPLMEVADIKRLAAIAHRHQCKLIIDNTFATAAVVRPLALGADIVVYSATKYLGGHSDFTGGAVISDAKTMEHIHRYFTLYGGMMSPFDAWLLARSLRTLDLRMKRHSENAVKVAKFLESHPCVERVYYPGLLDSPYYALGQRQFTEGRCSGMMSVDIKGGEAGASAFIKACKTIKLVPSLAGVSTTISYPAKTSHRSLNEEEMRKAGISMGQLRISVGLEDIDDILAELEYALKAIL